MEAISSLAESQAQFAGQASQIAIQNAAEADKRVAQQVAQQAEQVQPASESSSSNPEHLGQSVDTYA